MMTKVCGSILVIITTAAFAAKQSSNVSVTTYVSDVDDSGNHYYIESDGLAGPVYGKPGEYDNNLQSVSSILNANTYNGLPPGDWTLDLLGSSVRTVLLTLNSSNEIQPGNTGYTVPPNPPFTGTDRVVAKFEENAPRSVWTWAPLRLCNRPSNVRRSFVLTGTAAHTIASP